MRNRSFQLIRTNPRLTTNIKLVVSSDYNLYLESFNSCSDLSKDKYKHYLLKTDSIFEHDFPKFYDGLSKTLAYTPYTFNDVHIMYNRYENQFDEMYFSGADEVEDRWYSEEFEYFAPLYVVKNNLPSNFIIMRVDNPVIYKKTGSDYTIDSLRNDNFKEEIVDKWKCVTVFDLSDNTNLGKFLKININDNSRFPEYSLFFDIKYNNFTKYSGMKYSDGIYTVANENMSDKLEKQNTHYDLEDYITKGFERNGIVYPYIFNLKFLYNDVPATPDKLLKYSMNRYYGFYTDSLELVKTITTYDLPELKTDIIIRNNIFLNQSGAYVVPFKNKTVDSDWVQYGDEIYEVRKQANGSYKIISDINLSGKNISEFNNGKSIIKNNNLTFSTPSYGMIDKYIDKDGNEELMFADLYLIEIDGVYHVLKNDYTKNIDGLNVSFTNNYRIHCDYNITSDNISLEYYKGGKAINYNDAENIYREDIKLIYDLDVLSNINTLNYYKRNDGFYKITNLIINNKPLTYKIYRVNFSDIKDFDYDRLNTSYSDFQYEKSYYTESNEERLNIVEYRDKSNPKKYKLNRVNEDGQYKKMVISSEYISDGDLYEIKDSIINKEKTMNSMWNKTQTINKWMYKDSLSHCDYPYKLNNSYDVGGIYNRTVNTDLNVANITQNNLDYFYRIGEFYGKDEKILINGLNTDNFNITGDTSDYDFLTGDFLNIDFNSGSLELIIGGKIKLEKNEDYLIKYTIDLSEGNKIDPNQEIFIGFSTDTFENQYINYKISETVTISFVEKSIGTDLIFIIRNFSKLIIKDFSVHKINKKYYYNQTSNIQTSLLSKYDSGNIDNRFNIDYYINSDIDYFDHFFNNIMYYDDYGYLKIKPYTKYSVFNGGTTTLPAKTIFNGIEYELYGVKDMILSDSINGKERVNTIIEDGGYKYNGYKMSVILSENYEYYKFKYNGKFNIIKRDWYSIGSRNDNVDEYILYSLNLNTDRTDCVYSIDWEIKQQEFDVQIDSIVDPSIPDSGSISITMTPLYQ